MGHINKTYVDKIVEQLDYKSLDKEYSREFSPEERKRITKALNDKDSKEITIDEFFKTYSVDTDDIKITRIARNVFGTEKDQLLSYKIPKEMLDIAQERLMPETLRGIEKQLLNNYAQKYNEPQIPFTLERAVTNALIKAYQTFVSGMSFGKIIVVAAPEEEIYRKVLNIVYKSLREEIKLSALTFTQRLLQEYFICYIEELPEQFEKVEYAAKKATAQRTILMHALNEAERHYRELEEKMVKLKKNTRKGE